MTPLRFSGLRKHPEYADPQGDTPGGVEEPRSRGHGFLQGKLPWESPIRAQHPEGLGFLYTERRAGTPFSPPRAAGWPRPPFQERPSGVPSPGVLRSP